jgi:hypothetical protein
MPTSTTSSPPRRTSAGPFQRRIVAAAGMATLLSYNTWLTAVPVQGHRRVFGGYLSELAASDQPQHWLFRAGDLLTGLLALVLAAAVHAAMSSSRPRSRGDRYRLMVLACLLLFAAATALDSVFALDCAPSHDTACQRAEDQAQLSLSHRLHEVTSVAAQVGATGSMTAGVLSVTTNGSDEMILGAGRRRFVVVLFVVHAVALATMITMIAADARALGHGQAVTVGTASLWFAAIGLGILDRPSHSTRSTSGTDQISGRRSAQEPVVNAHQPGVPTPASAGLFTGGLLLCPARRDLPGPPLERKALRRGLCRWADGPS